MSEGQAPDQPAASASPAPADDEIRLDDAHPATALTSWLGTAPRRGEPIEVDTVRLDARALDEVAAAAAALAARVRARRVRVTLALAEVGPAEPLRLAAPGTWGRVCAIREAAHLAIEVEAADGAPLDAGEVLARLLPAFGLRPAPAALTRDPVTGPEGGAPDPLPDPALASLLDRGSHTVGEPARVEAPAQARVAAAVGGWFDARIAVVPGRVLPREGLDLHAVVRARWQEADLLLLDPPPALAQDGRVLEAGRPLPGRVAAALREVAAVEVAGTAPQEGAAAGGALLLSLAAAGVVVSAGPEAVPPGAREAGLRWHEPLPDRLDPDAWALRAIADRRRAVLERGLAEPAAAAVFGGEPRWPAVSVVLCTRRPDRVEQAVEAVASQHYPRVELVLVLHGDAFDPAAVADVVGRAGVPAVTVTVRSDAPLGEALAAGTEAASGSLLAKMDDDDLYGPWHLTDLVLAHRWSGADVVGKAPALVHLGSLNQSLWFGGLAHERASAVVAGGTLLLDAGTLRAAGGWAPARRGLDTVLIRRVAALGGRVHATHPYGFVLVRAGGGHTWRQRPGAFVARATAQWRGLPPPALMDHG